MHQFAGEKDNLILLRCDRLVASVTDVVISCQARVVNAEFSTIELSRLALEKIDECEIAVSNFVAAVIAVEVEKVTVVASCDLGLDSGDRNLFHPQLLQDLR